jgi:hypothetical protein
MKLCGAEGHKAKNGEPCGYRIGDKAESCPHHAPGGSTAKAFQAKGVLHNQFKRLPEQIKAGDLRTTEDIRAVYAQIIAVATTDRAVDLKRLEIVLKALGGAGTLLQVDAMNNLSDQLARSEGHTNGLIILERMRTTTLRPVPPPKRMAVQPEQERPAS